MLISVRAYYRDWFPNPHNKPPSNRNKLLSQESHVVAYFLVKNFGVVLGGSNILVSKHFADALNGYPVG